MNGLHPECAAYTVTINDLENDTDVDYDWTIVVPENQDTPDTIAYSLGGGDNPPALGSARAQHRLSASSRHASVPGSGYFTSTVPDCPLCFERGGVYSQRSDSQLSSIWGPTPDCPPLLRPGQLGGGS